ncbi:MAG: hypothetical protein OER80_00755 [Gammaproteobacteria bacterium]|nr:hypothetical protein [Gammaproteobacteria bacterium]
MLFILLISATAFADVKTLGNLASPMLTETSGIAVSKRYPQLIWGINDGGNPALLHAFSLDGSDQGSVAISRGPNFDWEDLASFVVDGTPYLLIADTGDNIGTRRTSWLLIVIEPQRGEDGLFAREVELATRLPFQYEDGPRDCEAVAVDVASDRILLVSKRDAVVYELPLTLVKGVRRPLIAKKIASIASLPRPTVGELLESPLLGLWRHQPTAIDIADDGSFIAMMTYQHVYLFKHAVGQDWGESLRALPQVLSLPALSQTESVTFVEDRLIAVAEGRSAPIISIGPISH